MKSITYPQNPVTIMLIQHCCALTQLQQEQSLHEESLIAGGAAHVFCGVNGSVVVGGSSPLLVVTLTSTGIAAPVLRLNSR
jgi:hypothetical protein